MLSKDMSIGEINKLNYSGVGTEISASVISQCIPDPSDRKRFMNDYANRIHQIFSDCGIEKGLSAIVDAHREIAITNIIPTDIDGLVIFSYPSLMTNILAYVCAGKNSRVSSTAEEYTALPAVVDATTFMADKFRDSIRDLRKQLTDIERSGKYDVKQIEEDYPGIISIGGVLLSNYYMQENGRPLVDIRKAVHEGIEFLTKLVFANKSMFKKTFDYPMDLNKYNIDREKYAFYMFSICLKGIKNNNSGMVNKAIYPILSYFDATKNEDTSNLCYKIFNWETHKYDKEYTYKDFVMELQEYIKSHREVNCDILPFDYFKGWDKDEVDEFLSLFTEETLENFKEIDPEVLFLPNSKGVSTGETRNTDTGKKEAVFSLLPLEKREFYSKNKDRIHVSLLGEKKFKGYILNVLNNGYVIFEKYDTKEGDISSKSGAAYIMNIFNFKSLYTMDIREVRDFIKSQDKSKPLFDRVDYKCHMGNWQEHLQKYFDEDTGITPKDVEEVLALEKVRAVQYKKEKEEE